MKNHRAEAAGTTLSPEEENQNAETEFKILELLVPFYPGLAFLVVFCSRIGCCHLIFALFGLVQTAAV